MIPISDCVMIAPTSPPPPPGMYPGMYPWSYPRGVFQQEYMRTQCKGMGDLEDPSKCRVRV